MFFHEKSKILKISEMLPKKCTRTGMILKIREKFTKCMVFHEKSKILKFSGIFAEKNVPVVL